MARFDMHWLGANPALKYCQATRENMSAFYDLDVDYCKRNIVNAFRNGVILRVEDTLHSVKTFSRATAELKMS